MPVAIDTSILVAAEKAGDLEAVLSGIEEEIYVPAHAAAEFLVGTPSARAGGFASAGASPLRRTYSEHGG